MTSAVIGHTVTHTNGIHLRVATKLSMLAKNYHGQIQIEHQKSKKMANALNMLEVVLLQVKQGESISIKVMGDNPIQIIDEVRTLL